MAVALYLSKLATNRELEIQELKRQARTIHRKFLDLDELANILLVYDRNTDLLNAITKEMVNVADQGLKIKPDSEELRSDRLSIRSTEQKIQLLASSPAEPEIPASDQQIYLLKKHFIRAQKLVKELHSTGKIPTDQADDHATRLSQNALLLEVKAYRQQGSQAQAQGETSNAANFFKYAKELLVKSELTFESKTEQIKQVSREISSLYISLPEESENKWAAEAALNLKY